MAGNPKVGVQRFIFSGQSKRKSVFLQFSPVFFSCAHFYLPAAITQFIKLKSIGLLAKKGVLVKGLATVYI